MTKVAKTQIVIDNYFKSECDVNTSIRKAFEKGFRIGVQKGSVAAVPVKHGHWVNNGLEPLRCSECGITVDAHNCIPWACKSFVYCPHCGARMDAGGNR